MADDDGILDACRYASTDRRVPGTGAQPSDPLAGKGVPGMKPGRYLDALVAEKIMGWEDNRGGPTFLGRRANQIWADSGDWKVIDCPCYYEDLNAAWEVVEKMLGDGYALQMEAWPGEYRSDPPEVRACFKAGRERSNPAWTIATTAPLAICLAALWAKGVDPTKAEQRGPQAETQKP